MGDRLVQAIVLVADLVTARSRMRSLGLTALDGGRHPGRGTANLIVPFGRQYLELLAVVDEDEARSSPHGRAVADAWWRRGPGLARWSVEPADIDAVGRRLGYPVEQRQRLLPDGRVVRWRSVGVDAAWSEPWLAAFMAWDDPGLHPARMEAHHPCGATGFARLDVESPDPDALRGWLGGEPPDEVHVSPGSVGGPTALCLASPTGAIALE